MAEIDDELEQQRIQDEADEFEAMQQQERLAQIQAQNQQQGIGNKVQRTQDAVKTVQKWTKRYEKTSAALSFLGASFPVWGPILGVLAGAMLVIIILIAGCNQTGASGSVTRGVSFVAGIFGADICKNLTFNAGTSGGAGAGASFALDITITSAYRAGALTAGGGYSAHGRGEAIDIALRNPTVSVHGSDPRIAQLVAIGRSAGFIPAAGDTLDEYTNPAENATGGHVHVEFNLKPDGTTYCDGTRIPASGPSDLVSLVGVVPVDTGSTSDPRVRPCMLNAVIALFNAAQTAPTPSP
ncbi:MAG: hypothetical protein ABI643_02055 [Candidatus Doudnabacteria bacterium]